MIDEELDPLPGFHMGEPFWVLEEYLKSTNYIGLGGIAARGEKVGLAKWLDLLFDKYPGTFFMGMEYWMKLF